MFGVISILISCMPRHFSSKTMIERSDATRFALVTSEPSKVVKE